MAELIGLVAVIIGLGVGAQLLADRTRVPSIVFLIAAGIFLGPEGIGYITRDTFGTALPTIVGLSVAIIVFEGAFHLRLSRLREAPTATIRLVTLGAAISFLATSVVVRYAIPTRWSVAFLIGALLIATGPTVITPILQVVPVRDRVATALETEGIVNDVTAAILAVVIFELIVAESDAPGVALSLFAERLGIGLFVGLIVALTVWYLLRFVDLSPGNAPRNARLLVLAGALVAYAGADTLVSEGGVAAAATAGIVLGNLDVPYERDVTQFKGDITLLVLSFVFIALAALLRFSDLVALGLGGIIVVLAVALLIRPAGVLLATAGDRFTTGEKLFMSFVGPRGIIPASVATLFAVELAAQGLNRASTVLVGTVFLVIITTAVFEGGFARYIAEYLDVIPMRVIVVGGGQVGRALAARLEDRGENIVVIDDDERTIERVREAGYTVHIGDGTSTEVLRAAGAENTKTLVAATGDDDANLLAAQLARSTFDVERIISRVNTAENVPAFENLGVETISSTLATAWAIDNAIERPALSNWMTELERSGDVQEIEITADSVVGLTIRELDDVLPDGCLIALVGRDGDSQVPERAFELEYGDHLTVLGRKEAVKQALERFHPHD
ncbi:potassium transporter [Halobacteriales archaeon QS_3_64_16]|nr:MAG: potassium transporter [Halobacteriales archaeon QS_3_64_16]